MPVRARKVDEEDHGGTRILSTRTENESCHAFVKRIYLEQVLESPVHR